jgi:methionyl-tRNA formyltransferase
MKIIFIGGVKFSHELLSAILSNGWDVSIVFSYEDSKEKYYSDIASFANLTKRYGIKHVQVDNINDSENIKILQEINPDLILVMGWSQLLTNEIIKIPKLGVIGSHPTELPKYRGRAPLPWTIIKNLKESALTFFYIDEGIDDGDILDQRKFDISKKDDATSIYKKMTNLGKEMLLDNLLILKDGKGIRKKQNQNEFIENWPKRTMEDGKINWNDSAEEIHNLVRATTHPYPGAFTKFKNQKLIIWKSEFLNNTNSNPGIIKEINNDNILVGTGKGILKILKISYQDECELDKIFSTSNIGTKLGS